MDYIGSKTKLLYWIFRHLDLHMARLGLKPQDTIFLDGCTGTGAVAVEAARRGFQVRASDLLAFPPHLVRGRTSLSEEVVAAAVEWIDRINALPDVQGFFWANYSEAAGRPYFTDQNAMRIDAARQAILGIENLPLQSYLFYCLIEAMNRVSNTAGTHGAFMKSLKDRARNQFTLTYQPGIYAPVEATQADIEDAVGVGEKVLYLDPPYTKRQYAPNYHLFSTVVSATDPIIAGVTGLPQDYLKSEFCATEPNVGELIARILKKTTARLVLISYSSDGTLKLDQMLTQMMKGFQHSAVEVQVQEYTRYRSAEQNSDKKLSDDYLREYLFIIEREDSDALYSLLDTWALLDP